jgi:hypothetical protein
MEREEAMAYPLLAYQILINADMPTIALLAFLTEGGPIAFALQRGQFEELASAFKQQASRMPRKQDQN